MSWAARVFELSPDPAQRLFSQGFHVIIASVLEQLCQCRGQEFSPTPIRIGFEPVPFTIIDAEALMQCQSLLKRLFWPFLCGHVGVGSAECPYPEGWIRLWW